MQLSALSSLPSPLSVPVLVSRNAKIDASRVVFANARPLHAQPVPPVLQEPVWQKRLNTFEKLSDWARLAFSKTPVFVYQGGSVLEATGQFSQKAVLVQGDQIRRVSATLPTAAFFVRRYLGGPTHRVALNGLLMTPGLIDQHTHGAFGKDYMQNSPAEMQSLLHTLPRYGVTSVLATLVSAPFEQIRAAMGRVETVMANAVNAPKSARVLGMHLEGPFISQDFRGAHVAGFLQPVEQARFVQAGVLHPQLKLVTLAPELDKNLALTRYLAANGVRVSAGHTGATYADIQQAQRAGLSGVTHLFNAMPSLHHREPGVVGAALTLPGLKAELIADGHHVNPALVSMVAALRPNDMILVSDSMCLAGMPNGSRRDFAGQEVHVKDGCVRNKEGAIAGSSAILGQTVQAVSRQGLMPFATAVQMASKNAADFLGRSDLGRLAPRAAADFVLWDPKTLTVKATYIAGQKVY
jgi:N-acetylglucosamine-6-phosphate deacetylase